MKQPELGIPFATVKIDHSAARKSNNSHIIYKSNISGTTVKNKKVNPTPNLPPSQKKNPQTNKSNIQTQSKQTNQTPNSFYYE